MSGYRHPARQITAVPFRVVWMRYPAHLTGEKIPIHYRSSRKQIIPIASASAQDVHASSSAPVTPDLMAGDGVGPEHGGGGSGIGESGGQNSSDRVIFAESPSAPGIPVVYRTSEERASNQDRLNLDRRKLTVCPILEGEEQLRLLNYQHNMITKVQHLGSLKRLIFLDLYDNQIEEISGLNALKSLRVLMLGKNKIKRIDNLDSLNKLDVLDLHGNQITVIENMNHLTELRVLNLAGNMVVHVDNLAGMDSLAELNLRRNKIRTVNDVDSLPSLQRLFLSFNEIASFEDIACLGESNSLSEVTLDGNPLTNDQYYKQIVLRHMQQLKQLDMKRVTEEERRIALVMARKDEEKKKEGNKMAIMKEKKRLAINNAKRQWEVMQGSMMSKTGKLVKTPELYASLVGSVPNSELMLTPSLDGEDNDLDSLESNEKPGSQPESRPGSAHSGIQDGERPRTANKANKPENKQGSYKETMIFGGQDSRNTDLNNLADLDGDTLTMYGHQSLEALDRNWGIQAAGAVTKIVFKFMDMDEITKHLHKIRTRFPGVQTLVFSATNIRSLNQINALTSVRRLDNLTIDEEGNPVTKFTLWRLYTIFRLAHFALKKVNDIEVSSSDIVNAEKLFGAVAHITTSQLPQSRLLSLLGETRGHPIEPSVRKQLLAMSEEKSRKVLDGTVKLDKAQGEFVGRAGLSYQTNESSANKESKKAFARSYINEITKEAIFTDRKRNELLKIWPQIFYEMVYSSLTDMSDLQGYMKKCMEELEKG